MPSAIRPADSVPMSRPAPASPGSRLPIWLMALNRCVTIVAPASAKARAVGVARVGMAEADDDAGLGESRDARRFDGFRRDGGQQHRQLRARRDQALPGRRQSSAGSAPDRARPCARSTDAGLRDAGRGSPARLPRGLRSGGDRGARVISGVSVISVGSSAVVPKGACAAADRSMTSTSCWSFSMTPPPPLTCRSTKPGDEHAAAGLDDVQRRSEWQPQARSPRR